jgi:hypothetical protein
LQKVLKNDFIDDRIIHFYFFPLKIAIIGVKLVSIKLTPVIVTVPN